MPIYSFKCINCDTEFEKIMSLSQKLDDKTTIPCPKCGSEENTPLISKTSFSLKGGGLYKDGYEK